MVIIHSMEGARERGDATGRRENALRNTRERAAALSLGRPPAEGLGGGPMNARCCPALPWPGLRGAHRGLDIYRGVPHSGPLRRRDRWSSWLKTRSDMRVNVCSETEALSTTGPANQSVLGVHRVEFCGTPR